MQSRSTFTLLFLFLFLHLVKGQSTVYRSFENINLGNDASVISCFLQDSEGLIWIGSDKGLYSFDGYSTQQHFTFDSPENTRIYCGIVIENKYLYLGSDNGIHIYNYHTDRYEESPVQFPTDVRSMILRNGTLWIGALNGLYSYELGAGKLTRFAPENHPELTHQTIYSLIHATDDCIYIGTYNGFCTYNPNKECFERIKLPAAVNRNNLFINSLLEDTVRNCIWIGTEGNLIQYFPVRGDCKIIECIPDNSVKTLALNKNGQLLAGTDNGLYVYTENEPLQYILHDSRDTRSLSNNIVWSVFTDRDYNTWVGTDYGISFFRFNSNFRYIPIEQITRTGEGNHFYAIYKDSKGYFWFGGTNGLIRTGNPDGPNSRTTWYKMGVKDHNLPHNRIRHIFEDSQGQLWIATDGSVNRYDSANDRFIHYNIIDSTGVFNSNWSYNILEDNQDRMWIATCLGGLFVVDRNSLMNTNEGSYIADYTFTTRDGLSSMFTSQLISDRQRDIWVLLYNNGIDKINPASREVTRITFQEIIGDKNLTYMIPDREGNIWIGYRGGLLRIDSSGSDPLSITPKEFNNSEVLALAEVESHIWVSTSNGVWVVEKESANAKRLNLMNRPFSSLYYDKDEKKVYMGSVDGIAIVSPDVTGTGTTDHPVMVTRFHINNEPVFSSANNKYTESIRYINEINLKHDQNHIYLEISDLPYSQEEKNKFVYKLEGLEPDWQMLPAGNNSIAYSNLGYGKYRLLVSKLNENGIPMQSAHTSLSLHIHSPWYLTTWAKIFYFLLFGGLVIWTINFFRVRNRLKTERFEKERIMEQSKSKIDFFTNISHDLKTPLSMIIAPVSNLLLGVKNQQEKHQLEIVQRNAMKLNSLIHQVLDLNRMDTNASSSLILSRVEFISFTTGILSAYEEETSKEKNIHFSFHTNREKLYLDVDLIKFESILNNLLSNAFKYTPSGGSVGLSLTFTDETNLLEIAVQDTGMGIPEKDIPHIFQRFFQSPATSDKKEGTGIGLYLVKTYTELHGGTIQVQSEENRGTKITIIMPAPTEESLFNIKSAEFLSSIPDTGKPQILIVEDNPEIADFISHILSNDYRISIAGNGKTGFESAMEFLPDLIIADLMMPVMNGLEMCRQLKKHIPTSTIPIIMLTAKNDKETELESIHLNIDAFIPKPFQPEILLSRIEQLMSSKKQMEAKARIETIATPKAIEAVSQDEKLLSEIIGIIEDRISDPDLNVNALSEISGINTKQLYRKVKQFTGMTPVEYIKSIRMKKAAMLLQQKTFNIAEVMYMVGFSNHSYFSKCFQKEFGKTPKQFMEENE